MRVFKIISTVICISLLFTTTASAESCSWYIVKKGTCTPGFPEDAELMSQYGAVYIDKSAAECGEKKLYLTFDAGYENGNIEKILDVMREENVTGAFFILSNIIVKNPDIVKRMADEGHLVCNHTMHHRDMSKITDQDDFAGELRALEELYREMIGGEMPKYYRPPEGRFSEANLAAAQALGYKTVFWSFAYADWDNAKQPGAEYAIKKILDNTHNGAIILLHPTSATNAAILSDLIKEWRAMGYRFGTLDELAAE